MCARSHANHFRLRSVARETEAVLASRVHALHLPACSACCCCPACKHTCRQQSLGRQVLHMQPHAINCDYFIASNDARKVSTCSNLTANTYSKIEVFSILCNEIRHCMLAKVHARVF